MTARYVQRIAAMSGAELRWRASAATRIAVDRAAAAVRTPRWRRSAFVRVLSERADLSAVRSATAKHDWLDAHVAISGAVARQGSSFVIDTGVRQAVVARIARDFPRSAHEAVIRADAVVAGEFDLLGYRALRFDQHHGGTPDWHLDPVLGRRAAARFWSTVPFLDAAACGDHKVIWELNRHQHLLVLGRAFWLTGDQRYRDTAIAHIRSWIAANPPRIGINWASMLEVGFRVLSWIWAMHFFAAEAAGDAEPWMVDLLVALDTQLAHIERNLSYYFSPNTHLLGEALALYVAGRSVPFLRSADRYAATGRRVLVDEIERQIAADGGHVERSTHYHRYALDFYLLALAIARVTNDPVAPTFERAVTRLASVTRLMADAGGCLPHIGDDDGGMLLPICGRAADDVHDSLAIAAALTDRVDLRIGDIPEEASWMLGHSRLLPALERVRARTPSDAVMSAALPDSGYYVSRSAAGDHMVVDAGPHGFANGGHAHADALSMTLSMSGVPLLIDGGTGSYTADPAARDRFRSSAMHNTLMVDGRSQSEPAGPFQWATAAQATAHIWRSNPGLDYLEASHDGYAPIEHRRHVLSLHGDLVVVADFVGGTGAHDVMVHWHLEPRWTAHASGRRATLHAADRRAEFAVSRGTLDRLMGDDGDSEGWHAPVYGRIEATSALRVTASGPLPMWIVSVFGLDPTNAVLVVDPIPVWAHAGSLERGVAVRIARAHTTDLFGIGAIAARSESPTARTWRMAGYETDARMLFCRTAETVSRIALVDGSLVRTGERQLLQLDVARDVIDLQFDLTGSAGHEQARISGTVSGATK